MIIELAAALMTATGATAPNANAVMMSPSQSTPIVAEMAAPYANLRVVKIWRPDETKVAWIGDYDEEGNPNRLAKVRTLKNEKLVPALNTFGRLFDRLIEKS